MDSITIEIGYIFREKPILLERSVLLGTTILEALKALITEQLALPSSMLEPETLAGHVGLFGKQKPLNTVLKAGDRIEIYDPLLLDPKEARRLRALTLRAGRPPFRKGGTVKA
ncbi:MAG: RnfH family protein [Gammaproteobacteria bacterium]|nr:RnfH family protein [Gammaproteobacteria bacterium]